MKLAVRVSLVAMAVFFTCGCGEQYKMRHHYSVPGEWSHMGGGGGKLGEGTSYYEWSAETPDTGVIWRLREKYPPASGESKAEVIAALRQLRFDFADAFRDGQLTVPIYEPSLKSRPLSIETCLIVIEYWKDENSGGGRLLDVWQVSAAKAFSELSVNAVADGAVSLGNRDQERLLAVEAGATGTERTLRELFVPKSLPK